MKKYFYQEEPVLGEQPTVNQYHYENQHESEAKDIVRKHLVPGCGLPSSGTSKQLHKSQAAYSHQHSVSQRKCITIDHSISSSIGFLFKFFLLY